MYQEYTIGVLLTLFSSVVGMAGLGIVSRIHKDKRLTSLFASVLLLNIIWFSSLIFNYFKPFFPGPTEPNKIYWFEFLILSVIYIVRFGLLIALLSLIQHILGRPVSKKIISAIQNSVIILSVVWLVSWIEIPLLSSRNIVDNLMVFTDFLIFVIVIAAAFYFRNRAAHLTNVDYKRAIIILSTIIIVPMAVGSIKLLIGASLGKITFILERSMIYLTLMSFNFLTAWWGFKYASHLIKIGSLEFGVIKLNMENLEKKYQITKREMEVIDLICLGKTNKEIADQLFISVDTVKDHNYKIFQKTGVRNRTQLVRLVNDLK